MKFDNSLEKRSEIAFLWEAKDCNPNGNPLAAKNQPRVDDSTGQAIVTDGRLKRYIRDELFDIGETILVQSPKQHQLGQAVQLSDVWEVVCEENGIDVDSDEQEVLEAFYNSVVDARLFGSAFAGVDHEQFESATGPIQVTPARSYNKVQLNDSYSKITSVLSSSEDNTQGTMGDDMRLMYALFGTSAVCNERLAEYTGCDGEDVESLDKLFWDALYNQTLTRSKIGQRPVLYLRVEYESGHHIGNLNQFMEMETEKPEQDIRNIDEYTVSLDKLLNRLKEVKDDISKVVVRQDSLLTTTHKGENVSLETALEKNGFEVVLYEEN